MALGVLNNLSAIYAENNLNNTNNSLQKVLQQLSSGSRINSGADDAAGLSLVNGLGANSAALTQSETNATEGVGLLQVADGALSQVTSLLNRAITLATEASNGTLNSTQESAANQEYQSIMAEINNIGQTTTYNQEQVFNGTQVAIYTGDSSTAGSSLDNLNIHPLSESSVGDTGGVMSYSNGQSNTFIDLSNGGTNATAGDALHNATSTLTVHYMATGPNGAVSQQTATISAGGVTGFADTAQGMINAINAANLGVTASFSTAAQAGTQAVTAGHATDTGILITGSGAGVGSGTTPGAVGVLALNIGEVTVGDTLNGTLTITDSSGHIHTQALGGAGWDTLANIAGSINTQGWGITALYSAAGTGSDTFTSASSKAGIIAANLTDVTATATDTPTYNAAAAFYTVGVSTPVIGANGIADLATAQAASSTFTADTTGTGGTATMGYSDTSGQSLSGTDLLNQADAQASLNDLNVAITDVAAMDGYIGAQINTLNSISQVMSTQQENVLSAQNAIQATDYASATSNMSKYEILSQTGIAALAQANSVEQEVTKLLQ
ncbi:MAG TPA: flagellin [Terracidiphilus sp.]|nr:flagellin [Terracidiphilus sp.]